MNLEIELLRKQIATLLAEGKGVE